MDGQEGAFRRRVFYIPGYDPFPARRYRELYRKEGAAQARIAGYSLTMSAGDGPGSWRVATEMGAARAETTVEVLGWSDIVRDTMRPGLVSTYVLLARTAWVYLSTGTAFRLARLRPGPILAGLYPVAVLLCGLGFALLLGWMALQALWPIHPVPALIAAAAALWVPLAGLRALDRRTYAFYLMHDLAFAALGNGRMPGELKDRIGEFAARIADTLRDDVDEVLVVGHSSGAQIAVSALARVVAGTPSAGPALSLLTLGQAIPMIACLPEAHEVRADLADVSRSGLLTWVDVSAPADGCSFALCDPVSAAGVDGPGKRWPLVLSAAFSKTLSPARLRHLRWRYFARHFQYLCAFDDVGPYDYFRITAGPQPLSAVFSGRRASASRIETAAVAARSGRAAA